MRLAGGKRAHPEEKSRGKAQRENIQQTSQPLALCEPWMTARSVARHLLRWALNKQLVAEWVSEQESSRNKRMNSLRKEVGKVS